MQAVYSAVKDNATVPVPVRQSFQSAQMPKVNPAFTKMNQSLLMTRAQMTYRFTLLQTAIALVIWSTSQAQAGPWPRAEKTFFSATAVDISQQPTRLNPSDDAIHMYNTGYLEYGLTPKLSLGINVIHPTSEPVDAEVFVGINILQKGPHALSVELGWLNRLILLPDGQIDQATGTSIGLAYGRGLSLFGKNGWATAELHVKNHDHGREIKFDTTLGINFDSGWLAMIQTFNSQIDGTWSHKVAPSFAMPYGEKQKVAFGLRAPVDAPERTAIHVGIWSEF